ncbi:hypothetical protein MLD38_004482 [Melastoma candidum]|uniref:Uncharacterized protein n=1 Tax=Melastoma candidum TaxID=119954 RepID=A0ACB9S944_9MYRT|nr:hypothetical protein MLD38_004482 [Melastoma candidum]
MALCDPSLHHCQDIVDCSFTKVVASRVGASISRAVKTREFAHCSKTKIIPRDAAASVDDIERFLRGGEVCLREFTLEELMEATGCFRQETLLGDGGFGKIYRGRLPDGNSVAIKVSKTHLRGLPEQFKAELRVGSLIARGYHPNLVPVMGYHYAHLEEAIIMIIVYPFMANGDLGHYFGSPRSSQTPPDWPTRKRIALSVARGIYSLHQLGVVHCDIKPYNVLLDENFDAHVGDLGLAEFMALSGNIYDVAGLHDDVESQCLSRVKGSFGYMSPEMHNEGRCSRKTDVYAFGVTLIQIVTNMPLLFVLKDVNWAEKLFKEKEDLTTMMHPTMLGMYDESEALKLIQLGLICVQHDPAKRPLMPEVIAIMEGSSTALEQRWNNYDYTWLSPADSKRAKNDQLICMF